MTPEERAALVERVALAIVKARAELLGWGTSTPNKTDRVYAEAAVRAMEEK